MELLKHVADDHLQKGGLKDQDDTESEKENNEGKGEIADEKEYETGFFFSESMLDDFIQ